MFLYFEANKCPVLFCTFNCETILCRGSPSSELNVAWASPTKFGTTLPNTFPFPLHFICVITGMRSSIVEVQVKSR